MKPSLIILLFVVFGYTNANSQDIEIVKGDLYFAVIDYMRYFDEPDSILQRIYASTKTRLRQSIENSNPSIEKYFCEIFEKGIIKHPYILIIDSDNSIKQIIVSKSDFEKLAIFNCWELVDSKQKVEIEVTIKKLVMKTYPIYQAVNQLNYKLIPGTTQHN
jgi:hypothetical protein